MENIFLCFLARGHIVLNNGRCIDLKQIACCQSTTAVSFDLLEIPLQPNFKRIQRYNRDITTEQFTTETSFTRVFKASNTTGTKKLKATLVYSMIIVLLHVLKMSLPNTEISMNSFTRSITVKEQIERLPLQFFR